MTTTQEFLKEIKEKDIHTRQDREKYLGQELDKFIDSMSTENFEGLSNFFETMPKLRHVIKVTNPKTKKKSEIPVEGLQSFFD